MNGRYIEATLITAILVTTTVAVVSRVRSPSTNEVANEGTLVPDWNGQPGYSRWVGDNSVDDYKLVVWTDYQCPACRRLENELPMVLRDLDDRVTIFYRHFPLRRHTSADDAAALAECSARSGEFSQMHTTLFATEISDTLFSAPDLVSRAGIRNPDQVLACFREHAAVATVEADLAAGRSLGITGTPSIQIQNRLYSGGMPAARLVQLLRTARRN